MLPKINPKEMEKMMRQLGMRAENIDASEVVIKLASGREMIIFGPSVQKVSMGGQESFQITGEVSLRGGISEEDVDIVSDKAGVSRDDARKALEDAGGDIAEAILKLGK